jgi:hypothetical protein
MCSIEGCELPAKGKGMCAKHYMRQRRHGSTDTTKRSGPKTSSIRRDVRLMLKDFSDRTFGRYWKAIGIIRELGGDLEKAINECSRKNGSMNMSKLERLAEKMLLTKMSKRRTR